MLNDHFPAYEIRRSEKNYTQLIEISNFLQQIAAKLKPGPTQDLLYFDQDASFYNLAISKNVDTGIKSFPFIADFLDENKSHTEAIKNNLAFYIFFKSYISAVVNANFLYFNGRIVKILQEIFDASVPIILHFISYNSLDNNRVQIDDGQGWFMEVQKKYGVCVRTKGECRGVATAALHAFLKGDKDFLLFKEVWAKISIYYNHFKSFSQIPEFIKGFDPNIKKLLEDIFIFQNYNLRTAIQPVDPNRVTTLQTTELATPTSVQVNENIGTSITENNEIIFESIKIVASTTGIYCGVNSYKPPSFERNESEIEKYLTTFLEELDSNNYSGRISIKLNANSHAIDVNFDTSTNIWTLVDANHLLCSQYSKSNTATLAKKIHEFLTFNTSQKTTDIVMTSQVFCPKNKSINLRNWKDKIIDKLGDNIENTLDKLPELICKAEIVDDNETINYLFTKVLASIPQDTRDSYLIKSAVILNAYIYDFSRSSLKNDHNDNIEWLLKQKVLQNQKKVTEKIFYDILCETSKKPSTSLGNKIVEFSLNNGADPLTMNDSSPKVSQAISLIFSYGKSYMCVYSTPLFYAIEQGNYESAKLMLDSMILKKRHSPILATKLLDYILGNGIIANISAKKERYAIIKKLLQIGANPDYEYCDGYSLQFYVNKYCSESPVKPAGRLSQFFEPCLLDLELEKAATTKVYCTARHFLL